VAGRLRRFPEYGVTLIIFSGKIKDGETAELISTLDERDRACRVSYFSGDVEVGDVIADMSHVRKVLTDKQIELSGGRLAFVYESTAAEEYLGFLEKYWSMGEVRPTIPKVFSSLKAACDWLELPDGACEALTEEANRASLEERRKDEAGPQLGGSPGQASH
jgi:hypothetical protein